MKKAFTFILLALIVVAGLWFRLKGISTNHSFWADEAYISSVSRDLVTGKISILKAIKMPGVSYQPFNMLLTAISFQLFGISEWSARLPIVIFGTLGIVFAYLVAKKLSDESGGLLAAFLYAFSQLNIANAIQAKPYAVLETLFLLAVYLLLLLSENKKKNLCLHILIIFILSIATLIHLIGIFFWIPYLIFIVIKIKKKWLIPIGLIIFISAFNLWTSVFGLFKFNEGKYLFVYNNITYTRELLWKNYAFLLLPAIFGLAVCWKKNKLLILETIIWLATLTFFWTFRSYSHNIRYLISFFGVIFVFFGVFWSKVGEKLIDNKSWLSCLLVAGFLYVGGYKIVRKPAIYYTPNADLYGDVQIADYKTAFALIKQKMPDYKDIAIFNDIPDAQRWYLDKQPTIFFAKGSKNSTLEQFLIEKAKYNKGLLIVEDWESLLPEDIKQYAKKNMTRVIRVEGLPEAQGDNWPLEVYSWEN